MSDQVVFEPLAGGPVLAGVMSPTITVAGRAVEAVVSSADDRDVTLRFRPYQAVRVTTYDCFLAPGDLPRRLPGIFWARSSPWLDELTRALAEIDHTADFMQQAIHFLVPAGDDVLEVVAFRITIERAGAPTLSWPETDT